MSQEISKPVPRGIEQAKNLLTRRMVSGVISKIGGILPHTDEDLDAWVTYALDQDDHWLLEFLLMAAQHKKRPIDARHLPRIGFLIQNARTFGMFAFNTKGDTVGKLVDAVRTTIGNPEIKATALLIAGTLCKEQKKPYPPELLTEARLLARDETIDQTGNEEIFVQCLATAVDDSAVVAIVKQRLLYLPGDETAGLLTDYIAAMRKDGVSILPAAVETEVARGFTLRRSVERVGRNDPCPCGSGKKYKQCCAGQDQQRLHDSSYVEGKTFEELIDEMEPHLSEEQIKRLPPKTLLRLDPQKIDPTLWGPFFNAMLKHHLHDGAVAALRKVETRPQSLTIWGLLVYAMSRVERPDLVRELINRTAEPGPVLKSLPCDVQLPLMKTDPSATLQLIIETAKKAVEGDDLKKAGELATGLLGSDMKHLGILIARGVIPMLSESQGENLYREILKARDRLTLPDGDPVADVMEMQFGHDVVDEDEEFDAEELRLTRKKLGDKAAEVRRLNEKLDHLQKQMAKLEQAKAQPVAAGAAPDDTILRDLRDKVHQLKSVLKERNDERTSLRRDLQKAEADLEAMRSEPMRSVEQEERAEANLREQELLLTGEIEGNQPVRLIEFPKKFEETLAKFPKQIARGALAAIGRIAGGESSAFAGVVRLKLHPEVYRQRIGIDHRLLFRMSPNTVQVVDLINRKDLEKRIKTLD